MNSFNDQDGMDFFEKPLSTHAERTSSTVCQETAEIKLADASRFVYSVGSSDFATWDETGTLETTIVFPFEVVLEATATMKARSIYWNTIRYPQDTYGASYFE